MAAMSLEKWALPRLQQLLPLDDESLRQIIAYADSLPKSAAAEHLKNLLGDEPKSLEFISSFNLRRQNAPASPDAGAIGSEPMRNTLSTLTPAGPRRPIPQKKQRANLRAPPPRQVEDHGNTAGGYQKHSVDDYIPGASRQRHKDEVAGNLALRGPMMAGATQIPLITDTTSPPPPKPMVSKPPPSAAGVLISESLTPRKSVSLRTSAQSSRTSSPAPKAKVTLSGGTAMHGASTALSDLDSAIRSLELQTNPTLSSTSASASDDAKRRCNCMATRHPLLDIAPNCMSCGKVICVKEGLGPCTFCKSPLLTVEDLQKVLSVLKSERGEEKMKLNNASHKKAEVALGKARAFTGRDFLAQTPSARSSPFSSTPATPAGSDDEAGDKAKAHRDKLLSFQANNARRTQIHDEAADFDVPSAGTNMWASPQERAQQLKKQQRMLREMQWNARPEYEKRQVVASIDVKDGKIVRKVAQVEKPNLDGDDQEQDDYLPLAPRGGGAFSNNPLAAGLIRPTAREGKGKGVAREKRDTWRRVQMDADGEDNEQWILDGGVYGGRAVNAPLGAEEHACG